MVDLIEIFSFYFEKITQIMGLITIKAGSVEIPFLVFLIGCFLFGLVLRVLNVWSGLFLSFIKDMHLIG